MKGRFGPGAYLLTRRLTQDQLESMFGVVCGMGGSNWNPTALEAKGRLRLIMLQCIVKTGGNPMAPAHSRTFAGLARINAKMQISDFESLTIPRLCKID